MSLLYLILLYIQSVFYIIFFKGQPLFYRPHLVSSAEFHSCSVTLGLEVTAALCTLVSLEYPLLNMMMIMMMITSANTVTSAISPALLFRYSFLFFCFTFFDCFRKVCD